MRTVFALGLVARLAATTAVAQSNEAVSTAQSHGSSLVALTLESGELTATPLLRGRARARRIREQNLVRPVATRGRRPKTRNAAQHLATRARCADERTRWIRLELALVLADATGRQLDPST